MLITMIAAMDRRGVIGSTDGSIPWELPRDREHFRAYVRGKWMLLGRTTYEEMQDWFTDQTPVVVTSRHDYSPFEPSHLVSASLRDAIQAAREQKAEELVISGGASIYQEGIGHAEQLVLTRIDTQAPGNLCFPPFESDPHWTLVSQESHPPDAENAYSLTFEMWQKTV